MRDYTGTPVGQLSEGMTHEDFVRIVRNNVLNPIDYYLRDLSRGVARVQKGQVPDGSGTSIVDAAPLSDIYLVLKGRSGNQAAHGGTAPGGILTLGSTFNSTKGFIYFGDASAASFDETNTRFGIGTSVATAKVHIAVAPPSFVSTVRPQADVAAGTWVNTTGGGVNLYQDLRDQSDSTFIREIEGAGVGTYIASATATNPGTVIGWNVFFTAKKTGGGLASAQLNLDSGGASWFLGPNQGLSTTLTEYTYPVASASAASALFTNIRFGLAIGAGPGFGEVQVSEVRLEFPASGGVANDILQKWEAGASSARLDFGDSGASTVDMQLSGNTPWFTSLGDNSSGLRIYTSASTAFVETGTTAQGAMNLTLAGNRQATGTLLTSKFANTRLTGALQLSGSTSGLFTAQAAATTTNYTVLLPSAQGAASSVLANDGAGALSWASVTGLGAAASGESYIVVATAATLGNERALKGTTNQIVTADGGANGNFVLSAPQDLHTASVFQVAQLGIGAAASASPAIHLDVTGRTRFAPVAQSFGSSQNNYDIGSSTVLRLTASNAALFLRGFTNGVAGRVVVIINGGTVNGFALAHEAGGSSAANRFYTNTLQDIVVGLGDAKLCVYDENISRWRVFDWITPSGEYLINGNFTWNSTLTIDADTSGLLLISSNIGGTGGPLVIFQDSGTSNTLTLQAPAIAGTTVLQLPDATDILVARNTTDTLASKTLAKDCKLYADTLLSGVSFVDFADNTKLLRFILSGSGSGVRSALQFSNTVAQIYHFMIDLGGIIPLVGDDDPGVQAGNLGKVDKIVQTANITTTNLSNGPPVGFYEVEVILMCTKSAVGAGTLAVVIGWTDNVGATTNTVITGFVLTATGRTTGRALLRVNSGDITYAVTVTGIYSTAEYAVYVRVIALG